MEAAAKRFFAASHFGVVGANSDPHRYGYKVFLWYLHRSLPVMPITPSARQVTTSFSPDPVPTVASVGEIADPAQTALSLITPPAATLSILAAARAAGVWGVWLQPGTYDAAVLELLAADDWWSGRWVAGEDGASHGHGGWCVLVDGDRARAAADKEASSREGRL